MRLLSLPTVLVAATLWLPAVCAPAADAAPHDYERAIRGIIERRCLDCHGTGTQEAGVSFAELRETHVALQKRPLWKRSLTRVAAGEMPPEDGEPLTADEQKQLKEWLRFAIDYVDVDPAHRDPGPSTLRRLNRTEYENTLRDLLGMEITAIQAVGLPDDGVTGGFDNQASALSLSTPLVEKYFAAADAVVAQLYGDAPAAERRGPRRGGRSTGRSGGDADDGRRAAYDRLIFVRPGDGLSDREAARKILAQFTRRAFRRPVDEPDFAPLLAIFDRALGSGKSFDEAIRQTLKPVLVSPHFLFRVGRDRPAAEGRSGAPVDAHELAVRLSYFLWSTMPDDELISAAESGKLLSAAELERQARRLLADPRGRALTDNFGVQWLQLGRLSEARPTTEFFPSFNNQLKDAMLAETTAFFDNLRREDRSLLELLDADYTFVNGRLAEHYGIAGVSGDELQRVALTPEHHRGGLLGMGSVLALSSHTFRTSPTQRGKYVLDVLLGAPPPPPPPANAGVLKEEQGRGRRSPRTFREQLAQHSTVKSCAACHRKLDPLGFALDNYDAIGVWRESTSDVKLDVSGVLPDGTKLEGAADLKRVLLSRRDEFVRNFIERLLSYAQGRVVDYYDEATIREIQAAAVKEEFRFSSIVLGIVRSPTFQQRRPTAAQSPEEK